MGLSSSQARLLHLTGRMHQIEYKAQRLEAQKLQLANESSRVYEEYENALESTKIQYGALNSDGTTTFLDATLNALENGVVASYKGPVSSVSYLLCDDKHIYVTPEFAAANGIVEGGEGIGNKTLEQYLTEHNCPTKPTGYYEQISNYSKRTSVTALENSVQAPVSGTSVYTKTGSIQAANDTTVAGTYNYTTAGTAPSAVVNPETPITDYTKVLKTSDPNQTYTVSSADELIQLANIINNGAETDGVKIVLSNDIDMTGKTWSSIGTFQGNFNGNGYKITGLNNSLFSMIDGATVSNVELSQSTGGSALAAESTNSTISDVKVTNSTIGSGSYSYIGGLIGRAKNSTIKNCSFEGSVTGRYTVGGLVGDASGSSTITSSSASADVSGSSDIGGLVGRVITSDNLVISQSIASGTVKATHAASSSNRVGGFIGSISEATIKNCSTSSTVSATPSIADKIRDLGGFAGLTKNTVIDYCASTGTLDTTNIDMSVAGTKGFGYFVGEGDANSTISNSNLANTQDNVIGAANGITVSNCHVNGSTIKTGDGSSYTSASNVVAAGATAYTAPTLQHNATPASATKVQDIKLTNPASLTITGTDDEMKDYLAYQAWNGDSTKSINNFKSEIDSHNYTTQQLAALVNGQSVDAYNGYNVTSQVSSNFQVQNNSTAEVKSAKVSSTDDILDQLAYDIYVKNGSAGDPNATKTQLRNAFSDEQLASLSNYYGKSEWNTIVANLASNIYPASVSAYTNDFNGYSLTFDTSDAVQLNAPTSQNGKVTTPSLNAIAQNVVIAMRQAYGETIDDTTATALTNKLTSTYGTENQENNRTLANINDVVYNYINNGTNSSDIQNLYNFLSGSATTLNITEKYDASATYTYERSKSNAMPSVTYETKNGNFVQTGEAFDTESEIYKKLVTEYNAQKAMQDGSGRTYVIVSAKYCDNSSLVSNYLNGGCYLQKFNKEKDGTFKMVDTSVSVETHLREVDDEKNLKKAEAKYESDMKRIDNKDKKYDTDLAAMETERNAIKEEIETLKTVAKDNVERTFKLFS